MFSVEYVKVDENGYAPQRVCGPPEIFEAVASSDPNFDTHREHSSWEAANYWFRLYSKYFGVQLIDLPPVTTAFK